MTQPLPVELLADLHAGVLDDEHAAAVRRLVAADPRAQAVLAALDATVADLRAAPVPGLPPEVAVRLDAALAAESHRGAVVPLRRGVAWGGAALLAAAAAALGIAVASGPLETAGTPQEAPLALTAQDLGEGLDDALGAPDYGPLAEPGALQACLATTDAGAVGEPLGGREVTVGGRRGVLLVLPTGELARFRLLVVSPGCTTVIADDVVGR
ncbi:MAG: hypothetical protein ACR2FQ_09155 [Pseudonocardiaceae bacterium]